LAHAIDDAVVAPEPDVLEEELLPEPLLLSEPQPVRTSAPVTATAPTAIARSPLLR
jgi:hypothetical protein